MKKLIIAAAIAALTAGTALAETIKVGVTPGEHAQIMEKVKEIAAPKGLDIEILEFSDYVVPNQALADGDLNANSFQHQPYLDNQIADRGFDIVSVGTTITTPMGVYSNKVKSLDELQDGATIAIPNDPTNGGRALLVLASKGLIKVKEEAGLKVTPADITENPKNITFAELDAAMDRQLQAESGAMRPGAAVVNVSRKTLLPAIEIDGGDPLARLQKGDSDVQRCGGFARSALLVAQHDHMGRA